MTNVKMEYSKKVKVDQIYNPKLWLKWRGRKFKAKSANE
jgi:hypothetical protein